MLETWLKQLQNKRKLCTSTKSSDFSSFFSLRIIDPSLFTKDIWQSSYLRCSIGSRKINKMLYFMGPVFGKVNIYTYCIQVWNYSHIQQYWDFTSTVSFAVLLFAFCTEYLNFSSCLAHPSTYIHCLFFRVTVDNKCCCTQQMKIGLFGTAIRKFLDDIGFNIQKDCSSFVSLSIELVIT